MAETDFRERLDRLEQEKTLSYERFEEHGEAFIDVMNDGVPQVDPLWASAGEIYEASDADKSEFPASGNRVFTSIYNLLCDAEVLDAFHDSEPYEINTSTYDGEDVIEAWEYVSGETYEQEDEEDLRELEEKDPREVDDLYNELKD